LLYIQFVPVSSPSDICSLKKPSNVIVYLIVCLWCTWDITINLGWIKPKDYVIGICCFSTRHASLKRKSKDWSARNQDKYLFFVTRRTTLGKCAAICINSRNFFLNFRIQKSKFSILQEFERLITSTTSFIDNHHRLYDLYMYSAVNFLSFKIEIS
jgi:hypothetical protein